MENCSVDVCLGSTADDSGFSSPGFCYESSNIVGSPDNSSLKCESGRRGRPKAAMITNLMKEGAVSRSGIRCEICSRVFPRDKSLQAHLRVHTGERPYSCDYPGCVRKFKQSGQLKTHQRLHTGERPFLCSAPGCNNRFTHANRHCSSHPGVALIRSDDYVPYNPDTAQSEQVRLWLIRYMTEKKEPRSEKKTKQRNSESGSDQHNSDDALPTELSDISNLQHTATTIELTDMTNLPHVTAGNDCTSTGLAVHHRQSATPLRHMKSPLRTGHRTPLHELLCSPVRSQKTPCREILRSPSRSGLRTPLHKLLRSPVASYDYCTPGSFPSSICPYSASKYDDVESSESEDIGLAWSTPLPTGRPAVKILFADTPSPSLSPRKRELPKKRWLRIARREEECTANSRRPTVLRYLAGSESTRLLQTDSVQSRPLQTESACVLSSPLSSYPPVQTELNHSQPLIADASCCALTPPQTTYRPISESAGSPLLSRLLTMPHTNCFEEDQTPLAVPLPHD